MPMSSVTFIRTEVNLGLDSSPGTGISYVRVPSAWVPRFWVPGMLSSMTSGPYTDNVIFGQPADPKPRWNSARAFRLNELMVGRSPAGPRLARTQYPDTIVHLG